MKLKTLHNAALYHATQQYTQIQLNDSLNYIMNIEVLTADNSLVIIFIDDVLIESGYANNGIYKMINFQTCPFPYRLFRNSFKIICMADFTVNLIDYNHDRILDAYIKYFHANYKLKNKRYVNFGSNCIVSDKKIRNVQDEVFTNVLVIESWDFTTISEHINIKTYPSCGNAYLMYAAANNVAFFTPSVIVNVDKSNDFIEELYSTNNKYKFHVYSDWYSLIKKDKKIIYKLMNMLIKEKRAATPIRQTDTPIMPELAD